MKNKVVIAMTIIASILIIAIPTIIKVVNNHTSKLVLVETNKIVKEAKDCYYNESCVDNEITIAELIEKTGFKNVVNPKTNQLYNEKSYVDVGKDFKFIEL